MKKKGSGRIRDAYPFPRKRNATKKRMGKGGVYSLTKERTVRREEKNVKSPIDPGSMAGGTIK